jgi:peptide/nickel transport system permease protein
MTFEPTPVPAEGEVIVSGKDDTFAVASQFKLTWWRFRKHKLALISLVVILLFYTVAIFADFLATSDPNATDSAQSYIAPQEIHLFDAGRFAPHVYGLTGKRDPMTFQLRYEADSSRKLYVRLFAEGYGYRFLGVLPTERHLVGLDAAGASDGLHLLGTDQLGRDLWSRLVLATRVSLTIGLLGVSISLFLGILLGGLSGLYGGTIDNLIQRLVEIIRSIPTIPLWMGLAAALPQHWSVERVYLAITVIVSLIGWTDLARVVRGKFLSLREEDFVLAAELSGASQLRILFRHMLPSFLSHIIAAVSLALPAMIISETSLSFLGLGLRPPAISWGILLQDAQNIQSLALAPWLLVTAIPVIVVILSFNFLGDGLRDAADPYG